MNCLSMPTVTGFIKGSSGELDRNRQLTVGEMTVLLQPLQSKQELVLYGEAHYCIVYHLTACKDEEQLLRHMKTQPMDMYSNSHTIETGLLWRSTRIISGAANKCACKVRSVRYLNNVISIHYFSINICT